MKKKSNNLIANILVFGVFAALGFFLYRKFFGNTGSFDLGSNFIPSSELPSTAISLGGTGLGGSSSSSTTLRKGNTGEQVIVLQNKLNEFGYALDVDGNFGNKTLEAVKSFQSKMGLDVDGVVGPNTWSVLNAIKLPDWVSVGL